MARYWCKQCEVFVDDNKISRKSHENSSKHKNSVIRSISKLHQKNKDEHRQNVLAERELREIQKELGIKPEFNKRPKTAKKENLTEDEPNEDENGKEPVIGEWSVVEISNETTPAVEEVELDSTKIHTRPTFKKQSAADLETKNWDLNEKKKIDTFSDSDNEKPKSTLFKKRKINRK